MTEEQQQTEDVIAASGSVENGVLTIQATYGDAQILIQGATTMKGHQDAQWLIAALPQVVDAVAAQLNQQIDEVEGLDEDREGE